MPKTVNGCWLTRHGAGWRYKRPVPPDLVTVFGNYFKHEAARAYFGAEVSRAEAERQARSLVGIDDRRIVAARAVPEHERQGLASLPHFVTS